MAAAGFRVRTAADALRAAGVAALPVTAAVVASDMAPYAAAAEQGSIPPEPPPADLALLAVAQPALRALPVDSGDALAARAFTRGARLASGPSLVTWPADVCDAYAAPLRRAGVACASFAQGGWSVCGGDAGSGLLLGGSGALAALVSPNMPSWAHIWSGSGGGLFGGCDNATSSVALFTRLTPALPWLRSALASASKYPKDLQLVNASCAAAAG
jgi:hypothetical protein